MLVNPAERLRHLADDGDADSLSRRLRERRFQMFNSLVERLPRPVSILDVGARSSSGSAAAGPTATTSRSRS